MFEDVGFHDFKISVKHHDVITMVETYRLLASKGDWPLHLGVTEPAPLGKAPSILPGVRCALGRGIGDTIRVSLSAPPAEEVKVGCKLLEYMGLRPRKFDIISCPSCGRAQVDVIQLASAVTEGLKDVTAPIRVAVMGCIVNGPGEAREADLGVPPAMARARSSSRQGHQDRARRPDRRHAAHHSERYRRPNGGRRSSPRQFHRPGRGPNPAPRSLIRPNRPSA